MNVELQEEAFLSEVIDQFGDQWKWIFVRNSPLVQVPIVLYRVEFAIFLADQEATGIGRFRASNLLEVEVLREEFLLFLFLFRR